MKTTAISTMIVEFTTSFLVGQATLRSSPLTSEKNWVGLVRSLACAGAALRRSGRLGWSEPCFWAIRRICRFCWFTARPSWDGSRAGHLSVLRVGAGQEGLEPPTAGFGDRSSAKLSYCPPG